MLLTGTFDRSIDEKLRLALPKPLREELSRAESPDVVYVAPGTDGSLVLYPEPSFQKLAEKLADASPNSPGVRSFSRLFFARAQRVEIDKNGRLRVPGDLAAHGGIRKAVTLVGVRDHIELWDREQWHNYLQQNEPIFDEIAERAFDGPIAEQKLEEAQPTKTKTLPR